jgi:oxygen-independent coproporphyrinogen-3 oxidase
LYYSIDGAGEETKSRFLAALDRELSLLGSLIDFTELNIESVSIGGGTPSELSVSHLSTLLAMLERHLNVSGTAATEYSMEMNPQGVARPYSFRAKLEVLRRHQVNRLSFGVQSFDDQVLEANGSRHTASEATECVRIAREHGFGNVNIDLLFGLVNQSPQSWLATVQRACELHPEHISVFALKTVSAGSGLRQDASWSEEDLASCIPTASRCCSNHGYTEYFPLMFACRPEVAYKYEVNTFALGKAVLGLGAGSITWAGQFSYRSVRNLAEYARLLERGILPVDSDTIHYPCNTFPVRLAYYVADTGTSEVE